jgi:hypothetical protein
MEIPLPTKNDVMDMEALRHVLPRTKKMAAIRDALSRDYTLQSPRPIVLEEDNNDNNNSQEEVNYHEGATPLFLAVEKTDWRRALHCAILTEPSQNVGVFAGNGRNNL